ncbi:hypothetical protein chiPu_0015830 [Chiloscyllium punctatum]|uniref:Uncharacterized protein n=1 Tax=Chiloscyllium punctatum TaxID=137246 RepID=A0A401T3T0_CHIPU|nr:hypothetical protein [Chiloscyllium punctatum]
MPEFESDVTSEASALLPHHPLSHRDFTIPETPPHVREHEEIEQWEMIFQQSLFKPEVSHKGPLTKVNDDLEQLDQHPESQTPTGQRKRIPIVVVDTNFPDTWLTSGEALSGIPHPQKQLGRHENLPQSTPIPGWDSDSELKTEKKMLYLIDKDLPKTQTKRREIQDIKDLEGIGTLALSELQLEYEKKNAVKAHRPKYTKSTSSASSLNVSEIESEAEDEAGDELHFWGYQRRARKVSTPYSLTDISTFVTPMASDSETDYDENAFRMHQEHKQSLDLPQSEFFRAGSLSDVDDEFLMSLKSYKRVLATLNSKTDVNLEESNDERKVSSKSEEQTDQETEISISYHSDLDLLQQPISGETSEGESEQLGMSPLTRHHSLDWSSMNASAQSIVVQQENIEKYIPSQQSLKRKKLIQTLATLESPEEDENQDEAAGISSELPVPQRYLSRRQSVDVNALSLSPATFVNPEEDGNQDDAEESSAQTSAAQRYLSRRRSVGVNSSAAFVNPEGDGNQDAEESSAQTSAAQRYLSRRRSVDVNALRQSSAAFVNPEEDEHQDDAEESSAQTSAAQRYLSRRRSVDVNSSATFVNPEEDGSQDDAEESSALTSAAQRYFSRRPSMDVNTLKPSAAAFVNPQEDKNQSVAAESSAPSSAAQDGGKALLESDSNSQISEAGVSGKVSDTSSDQAATKVLGQAPEGEDIFEIMISSALNELEMEASDTEEQRRHLKTGDRCKKVILFPEVVVTDRKLGTLGFKMHRYVREQEKAVDKKHHKAKTGSTKGHSQQKATCRYVRKDEPSVERLDSERILNVLHMNNTVRVRGTNPEGVASNTPSKQETQPRDGAEESAQKTSSQEASKKKPTQDD